MTRQAVQDTPTKKLDAAALGDAELTRRLRAGDESAFSALVAAHQASMVRVARLYVRTHASAEEVVQDTWVAALRGLDRFEGRSSLKTWLFRILVNIARTRGKRDARLLTFSEVARDEASSAELAVDSSHFQGAADEHPGHWSSRAPAAWESAPDRSLLRAELLAQLESVVADLPELQRLVITLRDIDGWSSAEVCNALEISETNQRVLLHRARTKARRALNQYLQGDLP